MTEDWHLVCNTDELEEEEARRFNHAGKTYAVYNTGKGHYATDGMCTHEMAHLARGTVIGDFVECPLHQGRFHIPTGKAKGAPACVDLKTYPVKIEDNAIFIALPRSE